MKEVRFDDIDLLKQQVSEEFGPFGEAVEITQKMVDDFAALTNDHQWIHVDVERAKKESPFGTTIAHGFLILSLLPALKIPSEYKVVGHGNAAAYGADKLRFTSPVPVGARLQGRVRMCDVESKPAGTQITQEFAFHVVGSERPALLYRALVLYQPSRKT